MITASKLCGFGWLGVMNIEQERCSGGSFHLEFVVVCSEFGQLPTNFLDE